MGETEASFLDRHWIVTATFAVIVGAVLVFGIICPRAITGIRMVTVQILSSKQKLDSMVAGGNVGFRACEFIQRGQCFRLQAG
ncbi:MAG: hypothetical protein P8X74_16840 [Reinekea sp.]